MEIRKKTSILLAIVALVAVLSAPRPAAGAPTLSAQQQLLLARISAKQYKIANLQETSRALATRLQVSRIRLAALRASLDNAENAVSEQQDAFDRRLIDIYKNGSAFRITLLSSAHDLNDLIVRMRLLSTIAEADQRVLSGLKAHKLSVAQAKGHMEQVQEEQTELLRLQSSQVAELKSELVQEKRLLARVSAKIKAILAARRRAEAASAKARARESKPAGGTIRAIWASVDRYPGRRFLTAYDNPSFYRATGVKQDGISSWYGNEFHGRPSASGEIFNENDFTAAHRTLPFGTYLAVTYQGRGIIVRITDRGPFVGGRILDLSKRAAAELGITGIGFVDTEIVSPK